MYVDAALEPSPAVLPTPPNHSVGLPDHTDEDRTHAARREHRAAVTTAWALVARVVALGSTAALVPITLGRLGPARYGVWMAMLSVLAVLSLCDAGVGNAVVSRLAAAVARADRTAAGADVSAATAVTGVVSAMAGAVLLAGAAVAPVAELFNVDGSPLAGEVRTAVILLLVMTIARVPLDLAASVRSGHQEGDVTARFDIAASVGKVAFVGVAVALGGGLVAVVLAYTVAPLLASAANWGHLLYRRPYLRPRRALVVPAGARSLLRGGGLFLALQVAVVVGYSSDNFVGAQVLGPTAVTQYAVPSQLALAVISLLALLALPLWPAYAEASTRGDDAWIRRTFIRSLLHVGGASAMAAVGLVALGRPVVSRWSTGTVLPSWSLLLGFAVWIVLGSLGTAVSALLNALHVVRFQVACALSMAVVNVAVSVALARHVGVSGLIWGTVISYVACVAVPYAAVVPRIVRRRI